MASDLLQHPMTLAACRTKGLNPARVKAVEIVDVDIFLTLDDGVKVRVEISALPASLVDITLPETAEAQPAPSPPATAAPKRKAKSRRKKAA